MSVRFEYPTDVQSLRRGALTDTAISNGEQPILAAAINNGEVLLYGEEGDRLDPDLQLGRPSSEASKLVWHPRLNLLATGWADGVVATWGDKERVWREEKVHKAAITLLIYSPEGSRLMSGDAAGVLVVWAIDARGRLQQLCKYDKKGAITHLVFRSPSSAGGPREDGSPPPCPSFFFGGSSGIIVFADDLNHSSDVIKTGSPISYMYYNQPKDYLVLITVDVVLYKYKITPDGKMTQERKVKLSIRGDGTHLRPVFAGHGLLAAANGENLVRLWHLEKEDNYTLSLTDAKHMAIPKDVITCIAFNPKKRILAAGTQAGRVVFWKFIGRSAAGVDPSPDDWEVQAPVETNYGGSGSGNGVQSIKWGEELLAVASFEGVSVVNETVLRSKFLPSTGVSLMQLSSDSLVLHSSTGRIVRISSSIRIKGFDINDKYLVVYNGKKCEVRQVPDFKSSERIAGELSVVSSFLTKAHTAIVHNDNIYACVGPRIEILNLQGVFKNALAFTEAEGMPTFLIAQDNFMACATNNNVVKLWDISRREPKTIVPGRQFGEDQSATPNTGNEREKAASVRPDEAGLNGIHIRSLSINCGGNKIAIIADRLEEEAGAVLTPDSRLHVYDVELDKVFSHEFGPRYYPVRMYWDPREPKLISVETKKFEVQTKEAKEDATGAGKKDEKKEEDDDPSSDVSVESSLSGGEVTTLFATSDYGVLMQDSFSIDGTTETLLAISVPYILFMNRPVDQYEDEPAALGALPRLKRRPMRDFVGMEDVNEETKKDLLAFSYFLTVGNMDEAYRAVKKIQANNIWENMAHMCVKTKRLDVAEVCLGNMGNAKGAKAVREAKQHPEKDAQVAMLAIQLNLLEDAERLYKECGRYDLLVQLYMASGRWKEALKTAAKHDRIHLKTTHYLYARHLEHMGDTLTAIQHYEKSQTHKHEVPRMLFDSQHIPELEQYIKESQDPQLLRWWAQYCESNGSYDEAVRYYDMAKETLALVRVLCFRGEDERAAKVCVDSGDMAACYHLARQYEQQQRIGDAIHFYKLAKRFNHGIRLAKENFLDNDLLTLSLECSNADLKLEAAHFFEEKGDLDKAVLLYQKGGNIPRALELCFQGQLFDSLRTISESLGTDTDPALLAKCGDFFFAHGQYEKAAHLFITAKQYMKALTLCMKHNIKISEQMAERMTPPKTKDESERKAREELLKKLAHCCKDQGEYHLACKKYTQAGEHVRAMKCLLKTNDTEKICYYASMTKQREIFILAANYLQNLDWHNDADIMKKIVEFLTKAKAMAQLAVFYDACAQVEIDEYRDYEKALGALQDSQKFIIKGKDIPQREEKLASLDQRIRLVQKFVDARKAVKTNPDEMISICHSILDSGESVEAAIRVGDVYALLIEYFHSVADYHKAYDIIERMRGAGIILSPYLDQGMVQRIHQEVGQPMQPEQQQWQQGEQGEQGEEDIGEDIAEDM